MRIPNKIPRAIGRYEKEIKQLVHALGLARRDIINAFIEERKKRKLSLRKAAKQLSISPAYLSDIERGNRELSVTLFEKIKKF